MAVLQNITDHFNEKVAAYRVWVARMMVILAEDRRGWWICLAVLIVTIVRSGITYSFGVFVVELEALYHRPMAEQSKYYADNMFIIIDIVTCLLTLSRVSLSLLLSSL